jgi:ribosomal protein S18 acetylase RimI-like enzyme
MSADDPGVVVRPTRTARWNLVRDGVAVARADAVCRPDRRWFVSVDAWQEEDHDPLVNAMVADLGLDLHTRIDGADTAALQRWSRWGFLPERREVELLIPSDPHRSGLADTLLPVGLVLLAPDEVDETELRDLDGRLRSELPGMASWVHDPEEFHDHTFDEAYAVPGTHLVAVDQRGQQFAGVVRVWVGRYRARLGLVGVARPYRRRGLARWLLASALLPVHERGIGEVMAEVDDTNLAGLALLAGVGAVSTGSSVVLRRLASPCPG